MGKLRSVIFEHFFSSNKLSLVDDIARAGSGDGAAILISWSRSRAKMERLHNTASHCALRQLRPASAPTFWDNLNFLYKLMVWSEFATQVTVQHLKN